jgi:hypothetical protein
MDSVTIFLLIVVFLGISGIIGTTVVSHIMKRAAAAGAERRRQAEETLAREAKVRAEEDERIAHNLRDYITFGMLRGTTLNQDYIAAGRVRQRAAAAHDEAEEEISKIDEESAVLSRPNSRTLVLLVLMWAVTALATFIMNFMALQSIMGVSGEGIAQATAVAMVCVCAPTGIIAWLRHQYDKLKHEPRRRETFVKVTCIAAMLLVATGALIYTGSGSRAKAAFGQIKHVELQIAELELEAADPDAAFERKALEQIKDGLNDQKKLAEDYFDKFVLYLIVWK